MVWQDWWAGIAHAEPVPPCSLDPPYENGEGAFHKIEYIVY